MQIDNFYINLFMGRGDWTVISEINNFKNEELNDIGYTGKLYGKQMSFQQYFDVEFRYDTRFKVELIKGDCGDFLETYLVTKVKL